MGTGTGGLLQWPGAGALPQPFPGFHFLSLWPLAVLKSLALSDGEICESCACCGDTHHTCVCQGVSAFLCAVLDVCACMCVFRLHRERERGRHKGRRSHHEIKAAGNRDRQKERGWGETEWDREDRRGERKRKKERDNERKRGTYTVELCVRETCLVSSSRPAYTGQEEIITGASVMITVSLCERCVPRV